MKISILSLLSIFFTFGAFAQQLSGSSSTYFEIRKYYANEGKLPDLIKRFQDHTMELFEKSGMENIAYFLPVDNTDNSMTYILGYPDEKSRDRMWEKFANDPEWKKAKAASEVNGGLVKSVDQTFMKLAKGLNDTPTPQESGIFQLRTYTSLDGRLDNLLRRFKDHTQDLFEKQGLRNYPYWVTVEKDGSQPKLVYLLADKDQASFEMDFQNFIKDSAWVKARDASEADGKIVEKVDAVFLKTLPFSTLK
ncbi:NIPSNAP protein [Algoriphagus ratkowskyi]|uniref:NIPSNAP family protein n=1 Tax=Algoriphagus ratkowskyi TaxID=57028 RepID=A0A2W7RQP4_9BACT|nr:NIPSNAP family protein [Algoriphagus ratkowskyi]PZX57677.1 NIPSNAP protein [Algoriphagus ratkowskyi]TXD78948.1 NIPSNAP family protein [Algoriphagus ratkowskyi]